MKLKKMQISGFKSFPEKVNINFPTGISAVVGPNGCGKSNVVDALRWVMGEQSVKQLRGKNMEDIIFSGAHNKPPLNMAEVSLSLFNDNGNAPEALKDFSEIMVTRRLHRSGEREYLINKQPCRLKDIYNLFMGSGMGPKTYAVIQQGNIGAITEANSAERRFFVEEAAGVTRYKSRKIEALRKVKATEQNLLRVHDIVSEISRQMSGLKRQARKAERYKKYQARIQSLDAQLLLCYYDKYKIKIGEINQLLKDLNHVDSGFSSKISKIDAAVEKIKLERFEKNQHISRQKSKIFEIQRQIDRSETDLAHAKTDITRLANEIAAQQIAHTDLQQKNKNILLEIVAEEKQSTSLEKEISNYKTSIDHEQIEAAALKAQSEKMGKELENTKNELLKSVSEEARCKNIYQTAYKNKESIKRRLKRIYEEQAIAARKVQKLDSQTLEATDELSEIKQEIAEIDTEIQQTQEQLSHQNKALADKVKKTRTLDLDFSKIKSKLSALKKMESGFAWYQDGVKNILQAKQSSTAQTVPLNTESAFSAKGIIKLTADIIEPQPDFAVAVEAVLGETLQYIIIDEQQTGLAAVDFLQENKAGRCGFIPIDPPLVEKYLSETSDNHDMLIKHVKIAQGYEKIGAALLGQVAVAKTLKQAIELFNINSCPVVTLQGDLISRQGMIIGGSLDKLDGILIKKQELKNITLEAAQLERHYQKAAEEQKILENEVRAVEIKMQQLNQEKQTTAKDAVEAEKYLYKITSDLKNARRHLEIVNLEEEQLIGEESEIDADMNQSNQILAQIAKEVITSQKQISTLSAETTELRSHLKKIEEKILDLKLEYTACKTKQEAGENTSKRLNEFHIDCQNQLEQINREIIEKQTESLKAGEQNKAADEILITLYQQLQDLEKKLASNRTAYSVIDSQLQEKDSQISGIQNMQEKNQQKIRVLEPELLENQVKLDHIINMTLERHQCSIALLKQRNQPVDQIVDQKPPLIIPQMEDKLQQLKTRIANIVDVNLGAIAEYEQLKTRFDFIGTQRDDLIKALHDLQKVIEKINQITQKRFLKTFNLINEKLKEVFPRLFEGGTAKLVLSQPENPLETGVEFMIHPPGKKLTRMTLLSGGEKALSAIAFIFAIFLIKPASFCLMDEIDAPLDDANIFRFNELLKIIGEKSQIIMITHNKRSMEFADTLFGITMETKGISKVVSVNLKTSTTETKLN